MLVFMKCSAMIPLCEHHHAQLACHVSHLFNGPLALSLQQAAPVPLHLPSHLPDGVLLTQGADDLLVKLWCAQSGTLLHTLRGHTGEITDLAVADTQALLASSECHPTDATIRLWCMRSARPYGVLKGHTNQISSIEFLSSVGRIMNGVHLTVLSLRCCSSDCDTYSLSHWLFTMSLALTILLAVTILLAGGSPPLMSTSFDGTVRLWDMEQCAQSHQYPPQRELVGAPVTRKLKVLCSAVCPQTQLAAIGCSDNTAKVPTHYLQPFSKL